MSSPWRDGAGSDNRPLRIGVLVHEGGPERGGGHTFVNDVALALFALMDGGNEWVLLDMSREPAFPELEHVERRYVGWPGPDRFRVRASKALRRAQRLFSATAPSVAPPVPEWMTRGIRAADVDFLIVLPPAFFPGSHVPFLTIVWDLEHRLQPFFPEVGSDGEWEERESRYGAALPRAAYVLTGTDRGARQIQGLYGVAAGRVGVLPLPTPTWALEIGEQGSYAEGGPSERVQTPYMFYPAQFWPHKNHALLLQALVKLKEQGRHLRLVLSGSDKGTETWVRRETARLGLSGLVDFLGFVPRHVLRTLYEGAVAMVFPSFFGPDNLPPLEAMAIGCPVLAARVDGAEEQLGDAALYFDPTSAADLVEKLGQLFEQPHEKKRLIERGVKRARRQDAGSYATGVLRVAEEFEPFRRCWPPGNR